MATNTVPITPKEFYRFLDNSSEVGSLILESISASGPYQDFSVEELRLADYEHGRAPGDPMDWERDENEVVLVRHWLSPGQCQGPANWGEKEEIRQPLEQYYWNWDNYVLVASPIPSPPSIPAPAPTPPPPAVPAPSPAPIPTPPQSPDWGMDDLEEAQRELDEEKKRQVSPEVQAKRDEEKRQLEEKKAEQKGLPELADDGDDSFSYMDECEQRILQEHRVAGSRRAYIMTSDTPPVSSPLPPSPSPSTSTTANTFISPTPTLHSDSHNPMEALQSSLLSGKFSDLTITHGTRKWQAHKVVVCSQSSGLELLIDKLTDYNTLDLSEYDHEATVLMMEYLYTSTYTTTLTDIAPSFSLPLHVSVFSLACTLSIPGLKAQALQKYCYTLKNLVSNLSVYYASVRTIYDISLTSPTSLTTTSANNSTNSATHHELRLVVVETAVLEMRNLLQEGSEQRRGFLELTSAVPQFQADIYAFLLCNGNPQREVEVVTVCQELCEECGAREEGDGYEVTLECKGCGEERSIEFS